MSSRTTQRIVIVATVTLVTAATLFGFGRAPRPAPAIAGSVPVVTEAGPAQALHSPALADDTKQLERRATSIPLREPVGDGPRVLALATEVRGRVLDAYGVPVEGAAVELRIDAYLRDEIGTRALARTLPIEWRVTSGPDGVFVFESAPAVPRAELIASAPGHATSRLRLRSGTEPLLHLGRIAEPPPLMQGEVLTAEGRPLAGAEIVLGDRRVQSDLHGRFRIDGVANAVSLSISAPGRGAFVIDDAEELQRPFLSFVLRESPPKIAPDASVHLGIVVEVE